MKFLREHAWCLYLGASVSWIDTHTMSVLNWKWWVVTMPIIFLVHWKERP